MIEILKSILYGIVEGITEWLPISSTGHMILLEEIMPMNVSKSFWSMFLVVIQLGAILAVVVLYWNKIFPFKKNKEGKYTYTVPVEALDKEIAVAAYSIKKGIWYDRTLTFQSETMKKIADLNSTDSENKGDSGNNGNTGNSGTTGGSNNTGNTGTNNSAFPGGSVSGTNSGKTDGNDG